MNYHAELHNPVLFTWPNNPESAPASLCLFFPVSHTHTHTERDQLRWTRCPQLFTDCKRLWHMRKILWNFKEVNNQDLMWFDCNIYRQFICVSAFLSHLTFSCCYQLREKYKEIKRAIHASLCSALFRTTLTALFVYCSQVLCWMHICTPWKIYFFLQRRPPVWLTVFHISVIQA